MEKHAIQTLRIKVKPGIESIQRVVSRRDSERRNGKLPAAITPNNMSNKSMAVSRAPRYYGRYEILCFGNVNEVEPD
jgi:hypothetical protein